MTARARPVVVALLMIGAGWALALAVTSSATGRLSQRAASDGMVYTEQGLKLAANDETGDASFGHSVAISADGNTAVVGGFEDDNLVGAAWIFTRTATGWAQEGAKLTGDDELNGVSGGHFGESVAVSGDGNTALIGGPSDSMKSAGAAWIFTRTGSTWAQQGAKLTNGTDFEEFGTSVALSADGKTALVGSPGTESAWVFSGSGFTQQGVRLSGLGETGFGSFGNAVALSSDGNTALVGGFRDNSGKGAVWVFTHSGGAWHVGPMLTGSDETGAGAFGSSVALSGDGNTALIGGTDDASVGAAWVFTRSGGAWTQQGAKLVGIGESGNGAFGNSVALSNDGNIALIGGQANDTAQGAVWVYTRDGGAWHKGQTLTGSENATTLFGSSVALSSTGDTALVGGEFGQFKGEAWVFVNEAVSGLSPSSGPTRGGTAVKISGSGFASANHVSFGTVPAASFTVVSDSLIRAVSPPAQKPGTVDVTVTVPGGATATGSADKFTYTSPATPTTTTTGTKTTTTTPKAAKEPVARIVYAVVRRSGKTRTLTVSIRASESASAQLVLRAHGKQKLSRKFRLKGGSNTLKARLAATVPKGTDRLTIVLTDQKHRRRQYSITVAVPA